MAKTLSDLAKQAAALPEELQRAQRRGIEQAALHVTRAIRVEIKAVTGDMKLSGVGRRGARVGAEYDVKGTVNPTAIVRAKGPLHFIEHDMDPHRIGPRGRRVSKRARRGGGPRYLSGAKALHFNGRFASSVTHPGTTGSRPFEKGYLKSAPQTGAKFDAEIRKAIARTLS